MTQIREIENVAQTKQGRGVHGFVSHAYSVWCDVPLAKSMVNPPLGRSGLLEYQHFNPDDDMIIRTCDF